MLSHLKKTKLSQGFTIIEVLIVLAIAGLILLVVFLAVPALQRNARNTQRGSDVSSLVGAFNEYVNNNGGTIPASCTGATPCTFLSNAKIGFYQANTATNFTFTNNTAAAAPSDPANVSNLVMASYSTCNANGTAAQSTNATPRSVIILYDVETGSGMQEQCKTVQ